MALVPSPICQSFTQQLCFFINFIKFSSFHTCTHLIWLSPPTWGCHHPPQLTGHLSHPPAGPVPLSVPLPIDCYRFHTQSVCLSTCLSANPPTFQFRSIWHPHPHPYLSICNSVHTHPSVHPPNPPGLHALFCQSICLSTYLGLVPSPSIVTTG